MSEPMRTGGTAHQKPQWTWPVVCTVVITEEDWAQHPDAAQRRALIEAKVDDARLSLLDYINPRMDGP